MAGGGRAPVLRHHLGAGDVFLSSGKHPILENNQIFFQILLKYFYHLNKIFIHA